MKYFAACGSAGDIAAVTVMPPKRVLLSYHYFKKKGELVKDCLSQGFDVFIDSGAFSAETKGAAINLDEYCKFIIDTGVITYAGLDVIGDAAKTMENVRYMEKEYGLKPIPTFHVGSSLKDLEAVIDYHYIAFGGLVWTEGIRAHLNGAWNFILKNNPRIKVHGFGTTNVELMKTYPWYSVDSSSYKWCKRYGNQWLLDENFEMTMYREDVYLEMLEAQGYKGIKEAPKKEKYFLYDYHSSQAYKMYATHLKEVNKHKNFDYLKAQSTLFDAI